MSTRQDSPYTDGQAPSTQAPTLLRDLHLDDKYTLEQGRVLVSGLQALARLPIDLQRVRRRRGLRTAVLISGYPGSPLAGFDKELERNRGLLNDHEVVHRPGVNEELAATALIGSQLASAQATRMFDGVAGLWYGKSPGVDRSGDALKHGNYAGTDPEGGVLVAAGDDPSCKSSSIPSRSEVALADAFMPVLFPSDQQDVIDLGLHGYRLSAIANLWVGFKVVTAVADGFSDIDVDPGRHAPIAEPMPGTRRPVNLDLLPPMSLETEIDIHERRLPHVLAYARANQLNRVALRTSDDWLGIVAAGTGYATLRQALDDLGLSTHELQRLGVRILKPGLIWPLDPQFIREATDGLEKLVVIEDKSAFLETQIKEALYGRPTAPAIIGKSDGSGAEGFAPYNAIETSAVARTVGSIINARVGGHPAIAGRLEEPRAPARPAALPLVPTRTPFYCSGCPHNRSTQTPSGTMVGGGIGCHSMTIWMDPEEYGDVLGITHMGGEGAQWVGMAPFVSTPHLIQNVGDGTFFHSAQLALRSAVAANVNMTYRILYNGAIAMTGGQQVAGTLDVPELTHLLAAEGVRKTIITAEDPKEWRRSRFAPGVKVWHRDRLTEAQQALAEVEGVTALIHVQHCTAELRRLRKRGQAPQRTERVVINERVCEGCGDCARASNCLSLVPVETEFGTKTAIHQSSCNQDYSCLLGDCPSFISIEPGSEEVAPATISSHHRPTDEFGDPTTLYTDPSLPPVEESYAIRMAGVGGTGVVTVSQVLATAALLEGWRVSGLDQTGLSQKGGSVVSDIHVARDDIHRSKLSPGSADLFLVFDPLAALTPATAAGASPTRTVAVVSTTTLPTGEMIRDHSVLAPTTGSLRDALGRKTIADRNVFLDAEAISNQLFDDHLPANILLLGAAYQAGLVPVSDTAIEKAIELNGVAVGTNLAAFRWGRAHVASPVECTARLSAPDVVEEPEPSLPEDFDLSSIPQGARDLAASRIRELIAYQSPSLAHTYLDLVRQVATREVAVAPGRTELTEAVAFYLHKLMAYKDEYEVARLHLDSATRARIRNEFGEDAKVSVYLQPPILRALGLKRKIKLGPGANLLFRLLRSMRRLRGTPFDPFGPTKMRRTERALVREYSETVAELLGRLTTDNYRAAVEIASLPDVVRGYEHVKLDNVDTYRTQLGEALSTFRDSPHAVAEAG